MAVIEVRKKENESPGSLLRRFSRIVQASGLIRQARGLRFKSETPTRRQKRISALHRVKTRTEYQRLFKLGKVVEEKRKGRR